MKLRVLGILALVFALGAVGAWLWFGRDGDVPMKPEDPEAVRATAIGTKAPAAVSLPENSAPALPLAIAVKAPETPAAAPQPVRITSSVVPGMPMVREAPKPPAPVVAIPVPGGGRARIPISQAEGKAELEHVRSMLSDFRTRMGENPVGTNAEIMKAVMGGNPAKARLGPPEGQSLNENGELVDQWGTPYFFHQLSKTSMEIRSAGPDGKMWTTDDVVSK